MANSNLNYTEIFVGSCRRKISFNSDWKYVVFAGGGGVLVSIDNINRNLDVYRCYGASEGSSADLGDYLRIYLYMSEKANYAVSIFYIPY